MKKLFTAVCLVGLGVSAFAQQPLNLFVSQDISYDDNIYLTKEDTKSSAVSSTAAGFDYSSKIPGSGLALALNGKAAYNAYTEDSSRNSYFDGRAGLGFGNSIFNVSDIFVYTEDPANSSLTDRAKRIYNGADFTIKTSANKPIGIGLSASDALDKYIDDEFKQLSRNRVNGGVQLYYNISPKTNVFGEYVYSATSYNDNEANDSKSGTAAVGIDGQIAAKVTGRAKVTYESRTYDNELAGAQKDKSVAGYNVSVKWMPSEQNAIILAGERKMEETQFGVNRYYITTGVSLSLMQKIFDKLDASLTVAYEKMAYDEANPSSWSSYPNEKRSDNLVMVRPSLDYKFQKWLMAGVWYQYRDRSSNQDFDYSSNKAGAYVKVLF